MTNRSRKPEDMILAAEQSDKIGLVVTIDVDGKNGREIFTGTFTAGRDKFKSNGHVENTVLTIGGKEIILDWDSDDTLTALIQVF